MGVLSDRFPDCISYGAEGGWPGWLMTIVQHAGGVETPNLDDPYALGRWNVARAVEDLGKHIDARRHFVMARSSFHYFRFKDWADFECSRSGDDRGRLTGSGTTWQINKAYGADDATFVYVRPLTRIVSGTLSIWRNNSLQTEGADYDVDVDTGVVTSAVSWTGATLETECEFDVLCRYDIDRLTASTISRNRDDGLLIQWQDIDIVEVREANA